MRLKIQDMINGKFDNDDVRLFLPEEKLSVVVPEHQIFEGSFVVESSSEVPIRGLITCPNPYMECLTTEFNGVSVTVKFRYENNASVEGDTDHGYFVFTTSAGEYTYDFQVKITRQYSRTSIGTIKTINDFSNLCKLNWDEALLLFQSRHFDSIFHKNANFYHLLYQGITYRDCGSREMEEFLIGAGKKRKNDFKLEFKEKEYQAGNQSFQDTILITKTEWGYIDIDISVDAPFIQLKKQHINMYDFAGKNAAVSYVIVPEQLHAGNNYARVSFTYGFHTETLTIKVKKERKGKDPYRHYKKLCYMQMELHYLSYLRGEFTPEELSHEVMPILHKLQAWEPDNHYLYLYNAYFHLVNNKPDLAKQALRPLPNNIKYHKNNLYLFYQFVNRSSLDAALPRDFMNRLRDSLKKNPADPHAQWLYMHTDETLSRNPQRIYQYVREYVTKYSDSPIFLQIGANLLRSNPELFDGSQDFDLRLLIWMGHYKLLTEKLALRVQAYSANKREYNDGFFRVLTRCSRMFPHIDMVKTICVYLIKSSCYGDAYFSWFQKGVEQHLKIAGLYEAYMLSWSRSNGELPPEIIKYFSMNSSLPAKRKAQLFSYVVRNKQRLGNDWPEYMEMVIEFAKKQLHAGYMSDDMAIIYDEVRRQLTPTEWDEIKGNAEYCYSIHTKGEDASFVRVLWHYPEIRQQRVPIIQDKAYVYLFHKPIVVLYEDTNGRMYSAGRTFRLNKILGGNHIYDEPDQKSVHDAAIRRDADELQLLRNKLEAFADTNDGMMELIKEAQIADIPVQQYKEQLMIRMLFTGQLCRDHIELFESLEHEEETDTLLKAYCSLLSKEVMMHMDVLPENVYRYIERLIGNHKQINDYCELAFLHTYAERWDSTCSESAEYVLKKYLFAGKFLDCYTRLPVTLKRKYLLMGLEVISYTGNLEDEDIYIRLDGQSKEPMARLFPGFYTYPVTFITEGTQDYVILNQDNSVLYRGVVCGKNAEERFADSRYGKMGALLTDGSKHDLIYDYATMSDVVDTLFLPMAEE